MRSCWAKTANLLQQLLDALLFPLSLRQNMAAQETLIKALPVWLAQRIKELGGGSGIILPTLLRVEVAPA